MQTNVGCARCWKLHETLHSGALLLWRNSLASWHSIRSEKSISAKIRELFFNVFHAELSKRAYVYPCSWKIGCRSFIHRNRGLNSETLLAVTGRVLWVGTWGFFLHWRGSVGTESQQMRLADVFSGVGWVSFFFKCVLSHLVDCKQLYRLSRNWVLQCIAYDLRILTMKLSTYILPMGKPLNILSPDRSQICQRRKE